MDDAALIASWATGLMVAAVLVAAAAALLIGILLAARRILRLAVSTLGVVEQIKANTQSIWSLKRTSDVAEQPPNPSEATAGASLKLWAKRKIPAAAMWPERRARWS